ncbi:hypothetical protein ILUMI_21617 [Ignelater luminosus]|uniref:RING-type E3 ubiquitin transferase n=1 Tax=Ignelater luminosus TaxID=2038154 RepID=A0A8K0CFX4_IGNLU|nr:hypothetical protein ILUMI_21617 [Ignelater luminosus]
MAESDQCNDILESFRCFQCKDYLSIAPIVLLPDGNSLCGICSLSAKEITYRQLALEDFLKTLLYPCKFKNLGCKESLKFGEVQDHDVNCIYCPMVCPASSSCTWEGSIQEIPNHFHICHSNLIAKNMEFKLAVCDNDQKGLLLACKDGVCGILKYYYNVSTGSLQYDIQHFNTDVEEMAVKISIINDLDLDHRINLKGDPPSLFNKSFYRDFCEIPNSKTLVLHNLFPVLNNPNYVIIRMNLHILKSHESENQEYVEESEQFVDYDLIKDLKCSSCLGYLLPPLYKNPTSGSAMCCYCGNHFTKVECELNKEILEKVSKTNFPCRWRGCETIKSGVNLVDHELSCNLRMFQCPDMDMSILTIVLVIP